MTVPVRRESGLRPNELVKSGLASEPGSLVLGPVVEWALMVPCYWSGLDPSADVAHARAVEHGIVRYGPFEAALRRCHGVRSRSPRHPDSLLTTTSGHAQTRHRVCRRPEVSRRHPNQRREKTVPRASGIHTAHAHRLFTPRAPSLFPRKSGMSPLPHYAINPPSGFAAPLSGKTCESSADSVTCR